VAVNTTIYGAPIGCTNYMSETTTVQDPNGNPIRVQVHYDPSSQHSLGYIRLLFPTKIEVIYVQSIDIYSFNIAIPQQFKRHKRTMGNTNFVMEETKSATNFNKIRLCTSHDKIYLPQ